jgi:hypothetical protein
MRAVLGIGLDSFGSGAAVKISRCTGAAFCPFPGGPLARMPREANRRARATAPAEGLEAA